MILFCSRIRGLGFNDYHENHTVQQTQDIGITTSINTEILKSLLAAEAV